MVEPRPVPPQPITCLWCGRRHEPRSADDLEAWARLCPECLGRAGENPFLRFRLREALATRAGAAPRITQVGVPTAGDHADGVPGDDDAMLAYYRARAPEYDDWYLRRGRYNHGPVHDKAWEMELDLVTTWLDRQPLHGEILELAAGTGWWSPLLASKGELTLTDAAAETLQLAQERLAAHRLRAHVHERDAWAEPDRRVDALFTGFWLSHVSRARLEQFLLLARRWLVDGGRYVFVDSRPDPFAGGRDREPGPAPDLSRRRVADGREFVIPKVFYEPGELRDALLRAGFAEAAVETTPRFFVHGWARA